MRTLFATYLIYAMVRIVKKAEKVSEFSGKVEKASPSKSKGRGGIGAASANLTNAEIKKLLEKALIRFENWKLQMETNPNPRMVHGLKNIISIIDTLTSISEMKMRYSYKTLSRQMSLLIESVAQLNVSITDSLVEDDLIDETEEETINRQMMSVIQRTVELIRIVQQAFGVRQRLIDSQESRLDVIEEMAKTEGEE
jgi:hypothetical protein